MNKKASTIEENTVNFKQQAMFWKTQHSRAVKRENNLKDEVKELKKEIKTFKHLFAKYEAVKAELINLKKQYFDKKSEKQKYNKKKTAEKPSSKAGASTKKDEKSERKRGQQPGKGNGHGRTRRPNLKEEEIMHNLAEDKKVYSICGEKRLELSSTEDSEEVD